MLSLPEYSNAVESLLMHISVKSFHIGILIFWTIYAYSEEVSDLVLRSRLVWLLHGVERASIHRSISPFVDAPEESTTHSLLSVNRSEAAASTSTAAHAPRRNVLSPRLFFTRAQLIDHRLRLFHAERVFVQELAQLAEDLRTLTPDARSSCALCRSLTAPRAASFASPRRIERRAAGGRLRADVRLL
jgi:hypothetical protein